MAIAGKKTVFQCSTAIGGAYAEVDEINSGNMSNSANNIDITDFSTATSFINRIQGLKDNTWSLSGFWSPTDTNGQVRIRNAWLNDTALAVRILPAGTTTAGGFKQLVKVSDFTIDSNVNDAVTVDMSLEGTGEITAV